MITGLAHICFVVADLEESIDFYQNTLDFNPAFEFVRDNGERYGVYFHVGGRSFIELFQGTPVPADANSPYQHFCLEVDDLNATAEQLRAKGVEVTEVQLGSGHSWQAWLVDPDGNRIELHQYTPESKQTPSLK
jgi:catechol 2,3-dioxygenase-like lactoylglutathione lyase family enzyme